MVFQDELCCQEIRKDIFRIGMSGGAAHLASCFSCVEILYTLYLKNIMHYDAMNWNCSNRDRFVLSKGHGALALYSVLYKAGFITYDELHGYLKSNSQVGGEPNRGDLKGVEASTGSLGHGLSIAVGMALAQKIEGKGYKTYVLIGDGECQEGTIWEAAMSATSFELNNLVVILDNNELQKTSRVDDKMRFVNWVEKWRAFGWDVVEVDGHNIEALESVLRKTPHNARPILVVAHTTKGKGVSIMEDNPIWHYKLPNRKECKVFMAELGMNGCKLED